MASRLECPIGMMAMESRHPLSKSILTIVHATHANVGTHTAVAAALDADWPDHDVLVIDATPLGCLDARALSRADDDRMAWVRAEGLTATSDVLLFAILAFRHSFVTVQRPDRTASADKLRVQWDALHARDSDDPERLFGAAAALPPREALVGDASGQQARSALAEHAPGALYRTSVLRAHRDVLKPGLNDAQILHALSMQGVACRWHQHQPWQQQTEVRPPTTVYTLPLYEMHLSRGANVQAGVLVDAPWLSDRATMAATRRLA